MENASKALIIAGAILLSILIIALGIYVFNMAKGASSTSSLDELEVSQFNQQFTNYRGKQLGSGVVDLLDKLIANASANGDSDERLPDIIYLDTRSVAEGGISLPEYTNESTPLSQLNNGQGQEAVRAEGFNTNASFYKLQSGVLSNSATTSISAMSILRSKIAEKHYYQVAFHNDDTTGLIAYVIIVY